MNRTPIEQAAIWLSLNNPRKAAEIMLQIIMEQEGRIRALELGVQMPVVVTSEYVGTEERNFTDGLDEDDNF